MTLKPMLLGDLLVSRGLLTADQLETALLEQQKSGRPLGETLVALSFLSEEVLSEILAEKLGQESIDLDETLVDPQALSLIPKELARRTHAFPISFDPEKGELIVAISDPNDIVATDRIANHLGKTVTPSWRLAPRPAIERAINQYYGREWSIEGILRELTNSGQELTAFNPTDAETQAHPIIRLVDAILTDAILQRASDIHFEPENAFLRLRYRIDGVLHQIRVIHKRFWQPLLVRLKILAGMNIAESRAPQDGRIRRKLAGRDIDFRAATHPTIHGENFVLRILDPKQSILTIEDLGLHQNNLELLKQLLLRPEGILLVTGPTGSGKTTTLYSILNHLNSLENNIMTLEDPVEYLLPIIRQTSIGETSRIEFAEGVRSLLRQDPDIILVGEIRDHETAIMAFRAAMTGHQVFSTLHTNSAIRSIPRLLDLGITPEIMAGNLTGIIAQRLVRKLCPYCKVPDTVSLEICRRFRAEATEPLLFRPQGCEKCHGRGYQGRLAIMEILPIDPAFDELISRRATLKELRDYAVAHGFVEMAQDGIRRICEGVTTWEEVGRVVDLTAYRLSS